LFFASAARRIGVRSPTPENFRLPGSWRLHLREFCSDAEVNQKEAVMTAAVPEMPRRLRAAAVLAAGGAAVVLIRRQRRRQSAGAGEDADPRSRWRAVTINRSPEEVMPDQQRPRPVDELGDLVEVEVRVAPGGRGSELRARLRSPEPTGAVSAAARLSGEDPRQRVRAALREAKQLIEVGEVLRVDPTPHGRRSRTPGGALVDLATDRAPGEGLL
jgi:hypothetical protein